VNSLSGFSNSYNWFTKQLWIIVMKFNSKKSIALFFCFAILGSSSAIPMKAEAIDKNGKLAEKTPEVISSKEISESTTKSATGSSSHILKESLVSNEDQYSKEQVEDPKNPVSSVPDNYKNLQAIGEIDDLATRIPQEAPVTQPVETVTISSNSNNQILSVASMPKLGIASQIAQVSVAQNDEMFGFRSTRGGPCYLGVGGNFGSRADFAVISKIGLSNSFSLRPSVLLLSNFVTVLVPFTYDFAPQSFLSQDLILAPYLGGGIAFKTSSDSTIGGLITAGVDIPMSRTFTVNVATNLTFLRQTELGVLLGIAYNF
jgi:hypothetical protein